LFERLEILKDVLREHRSYAGEEREKFMTKKFQAGIKGGKGSFV